VIVEDRLFELINRRPYTFEKVSPRTWFRPPRYVIKYDDSVVFECSLPNTAEDTCFALNAGYKLGCLDTFCLLTQDSERFLKQLWDEGGGNTNIQPTKQEVLDLMAGSKHLLDEYEREERERNESSNR
jgi:hypothetical protein